MVMLFLSTMQCVPPQTYFWLLWWISWNMKKKVIKKYLLFFMGWRVCRQSHKRFLQLNDGGGNLLLSQPNHIQWHHDTRDCIGKCHAWIWMKRINIYIYKHLTEYKTEKLISYLCQSKGWNKSICSCETYENLMYRIQIWLKKRHWNAKFPLNNNITQYNNRAWIIIHD